MRLKVGSWVLVDGLYDYKIIDMDENKIVLEEYDFMTVIFNPCKLQIPKKDAHLFITDIIE